MSTRFSSMLLQGGASNSLGLAAEVVAECLADRSRLTELYDCLSMENTWVRMRAADAVEKVCQVHPTWLEPYVDRLLDDFAEESQASIQWHMAQIFRHVALDSAQQRRAGQWLIRVLAVPDIDWIVAAQCLETLAVFYRRGAVGRMALVQAIEVQRGHRSAAVVKRADRLAKTVLAA